MLLLSTNMYALKSNCAIENPGEKSYQILSDIRSTISVKLFQYLWCFFSYQKSEQGDNCFLNEWEREREGLRMRNYSTLTHVIILERSWTYCDLYSGMRPLFSEIICPEYLLSSLDLAIGISSTRVRNHRDQIIIRRKRIFKIRNIQKCDQGRLVSSNPTSEG